MRIRGEASASARAGVGPQRHCKIVKKKDPRHRAREAALQILYQWDIGRGDVDRAAETFFSQQWPDADAPAAELRQFASTLAHDTVDRLEGRHPLVAETGERWRAERM